MFYASVEARLKHLHVRFINTKLLYEGSYTPNMFKYWWTQVGAHASLKEVKQRFVDSLVSAGINITVNDVRLWLYADGSDSNQDSSLESRCAQIRKDD